MASLISSSSSRKDSEDESKKNCEMLIPGLPSEIVKLCLLHLLYPYQALVCYVSSSWNRVITDPTFIISKNLFPFLYLIFLFLHFRNHRYSFKTTLREIPYNRIKIIIVIIQIFNIWYCSLCIVLVFSAFLSFRSQSI